MGPLYSSGPDLFWRCYSKGTFDTEDFETEIPDDFDLYRKYLSQFMSPLNVVLSAGYLD
jgi:hypothetical protein